MAKRKAGKAKTPIADLKAVQAAAVAPASWNADALTFDVIWSTNAPVLRVEGVQGHSKPVYQHLDLATVDLSRLVGGSVLDAHADWSTYDIIGVVEAAWLEDGKGFATLRLHSGQTDIASKIEEGVLTQVSVGAQVSEWVVEEEADRIVLRAKSWQPIEISLVPSGADAGARVQSAEVEPAEVPGAAEDAEDEGAPAETAADEAAGDLEVVETAADPDQAAAVVEEKPETTEPAPIVETAPEVAQAAETIAEPTPPAESTTDVAAEVSKRAAETVRLCAAAGAPELAAALIERGASIDAVKQRLESITEIRRLHGIAARVSQAVTPAMLSDLIAADIDPDQAGRRLLEAMARQSDAAGIRSATMPSGAVTNQRHLIDSNAIYARLNGRQQSGA